MKDQLVLTVVSELTSRLDKDIEVMSSVLDILKDAKSKINALGSTPDVLKEFTPKAVKETPTTRSDSAAKYVRRYLNIRINDGRTFSKSALTTYVKNHYKDATTSSIENAIHRFHVQNNTKFATIEVNGTKQMTIESKHQ
jgi:hypothetical protein